MKVDVHGYKAGGSFESGPLALLVGANGSGKSTLLEGIGFALDGIAGGQDISRSDAAKAFLASDVMHASVELDGKVSTTTRRLEDGSLKHAVHSGHRFEVYLDVDFVNQTPAEQGRLLLSLGGQPDALSAVERARSRYNKAMAELRRLETVRESARKEAPPYVSPGSADKLLAEATAADRVRAELQRQVDAAQARLARAKDAPEAAPVSDDEMQAAESALKAAEVAREAAVEREWLAAQRAIDAASVHQQLASAGKAGCCPTCTQAIPASMVDALGAAAASAHDSAKAMQKLASEALAVERAAREKLEGLRQRAEAARQREAIGHVQAELATLEAKLEAAPEPDFASYREKLKQEQAYARLHKAANEAAGALKKSDGAREAVRIAEAARDEAVQAALARLQEYSLLPGRIVFSPKSGLGIEIDGVERFGRALSEGQRLMLNQSLNRAVRPDDSPRVVLLEVDHLDASSLRLLQDALAIDHATGDVAIAVLATCHPVLLRDGWDVIYVPADIEPAPRPPVEPKRVFNDPVNPHRLSRVVEKLSSDARKALISGAVLGDHVADELCYQGFITDGQFNHAAEAAKALLSGAEVSGVRMRGTEPVVVAGATELELRSVLGSKGVLVKHLRLLGASATLQAEMVEQLAREWSRAGVTVELARERVEMAQGGTE